MRFSISDNTQRLERNKILKGSSGDGTVMYSFFTSLPASTVGTICGIGGGVIIKPVLDMLYLETALTINFLSGCTVLSMSCYSVGRAMYAKERQISLSTMFPLALGAAMVDLVGGWAFSVVKSLFDNPNGRYGTGSVSFHCYHRNTAVCAEQKPHIHIVYKNKRFCVLIGLFLGCMSSFLGIGGGPINLVELYFFFSMDTKIAASNSLTLFYSASCSIC